jgi:dienelactone hydrolase
MPRSILFSVLLLLTSFAYAQTPAPKDVDISAPDGTKLRATFFVASNSATSKPGPGVLLLHMCNTTRKSWEPVALGLSKAGINALTVDNRGFGESGGPRFEGGTPEVRQQLNEKWPGDFEAAYQFLVSQAGVDKSRIAFGGGSCGVGNAVKLAEGHPDVKALVLLAGTTDAKGINFIADHPERPIFAAAAADDEYNDDAVQVMQWTASLSANPRTKFSGFKDGKHGTEIFGPHPELVQQIVAFFVDTLVTKPVDLKAIVPSRKTPASEFWTLADQKGGAARATDLYREMRKRDPQAVVFPEFAVNLLAYDRLQAGDTEDAIELFKLNAEAYPASANTQDSLSDGYLAAGQKALALAAEEKCLELLPGDPNNAQFKAQLGKFAQDKIAKLKSEQK